MYIIDIGDMTVLPNSLCNRIRQPFLGMFLSCSLDFFTFRSIRFKNNITSDWLMQKMFLKIFGGYKVGVTKSRSFCFEVQ